MRASRAGSALLFGLLLLPVGVSAQQKMSAEGFFWNLRPDTRIRLSVGSIQAVGVYAGTRDSLVTMAIEGAPNPQWGERTGQGHSEFQLAQIDSVWMQKGHAGMGGVIGLLVATAWVIRMCQPVEECGLVPHGIGLIAASGIVGALIGSGMRRWDLRWSR